jgi:hypothetical protein
MRDTKKQKKFNGAILQLHYAMDILSDMKGARGTNEDKRLSKYWVEIEKIAYKMFLDDMNSYWRDL